MKGTYIILAVILAAVLFSLKGKGGYKSISQSEAKSMMEMAALLSLM